MNNTASSSLDNLIHYSLYIKEPIHHSFISYELEIQLYLHKMFSLKIQYTSTESQKKLLRCEKVTHTEHTWNLWLTADMGSSTGLKSTFFSFGLVLVTFWWTLFLLSTIDFWYVVSWKNAWNKVFENELYTLFKFNGLISNHKLLLFC